MPSSRRFRLATVAEDDLAEILRYTRLTWGDAQATAYSEIVYEELFQLLEFPEVGRQRSDVRRGLRSYSIGQHVAYYRITQNEVIIERLLHPRMKVGRRLFPKGGN